MKRDMDLVRNILLALESAPTGSPPELKFDGFSKDQIGFHVLLMMEAGLIIGVKVTSMGSSTPAAIPNRITWQGYEFIESSRDDSRWTKAKGVVSKMGGASIDVVKQVLVQLMTEQAKGLLH